MLLGRWFLNLCPPLVLILEPDNRHGTRAMHDVREGPVNSLGADQIHLAEFDMVGFAILISHTEKDNQ